MRDNDNYGQFDGDQVGGPSPFATSFTSQPWRDPPWLMWGNEQTIDVRLDSGVFGQAQTGQLLKINYGRPETWHWLFSALMFNSSAAPVGTSLQLQVQWQLTVGIGRSMTQNFLFDRYNRVWTAGAGPSNTLIWTTETIPITVPNRDPTDPAPPPNYIREIVAQDIQLNAQVSLSLSGAAVGYPYSASVKVGAYMAPKTHVRPDWFLRAPAPVAAQFAGNEIEGR